MKIHLLPLFLSLTALQFFAFRDQRDARGVRWHAEGIADQHGTVRVCGVRLDTHLQLQIPVCALLHTIRPIPRILLIISYQRHGLAPIMSCCTQCSAFGDFPRLLQPWRRPVPRANAFLAYLNLP
ncbi:hypothetical protein BU23DRAFT_67498 [Bimuria novae-zelandiae CBS 107.79]|uniref:Secreted protein n=1 Tax=Bimuria novae-zelandiae CBS 107.79 TaxID=1447943 RepID=A0A6A5VGE3_9PLEO|nr:hypothetical protein BU23DRAFT_67498 [Bimuria novae-zelandiae CBS 107.79]